MTIRLPLMVALYRCWPEEEQLPYDIINLFNNIGLVEQADSERNEK